MFETKPGLATRQQVVITFEARKATFSGPGTTNGHDLTGGAESLDSDAIHGLIKVQKQSTGEVGEAGRAAHEGRRIRQNQRGKIMLGESAGGPRVGGWDDARVRNGRLRSGKFMGEVQVIRRSH